MAYVWQIDFVSILHIRMLFFVIIDANTIGQSEYFFFACNAAHNVVSFTVAVARECSVVCSLLVCAKACSLP